MYGNGIGKPFFTFLFTTRINHVGQDAIHGTFGWYNCIYIYMVTPPQDLPISFFNGIYSIKCLFFRCYVSFKGDIYIMYILQVFHLFRAARHSKNTTASPVAGSGTWGNEQPFASDVNVLTKWVWRYDWTPKNIPKNNTWDSTGMIGRLRVLHPLFKPSLFFFRGRKLVMWDPQDPDWGSVKG